MKLSKRLQCVANFVPNNVTIADIGADRGELSYTLLEINRVQKAILSDRSKRSLARARELFANNPLETKVEFRIGDGLTVLEPKEVDVAILAGMGGCTICHILEASPTVLQSLKGIIIQAMGKSHDLRHCLMKQKFTITAEEILYEDDHFYTIIAAEPGEMILSPEQCFAGPLLLKENPPLLKELLQEEINYRQKVVDELIIKKQGGKKQQMFNEEIAFIRRITEGL